MKPKAAREVCQLVAGIIATDGELHPTEGSLMRRIQARLGLSAHGDADIEPTLAGADAARAVADLPESVRAEALELLIDAVIVDGKVVPAEQQYLQAVAEVMGVSAEQLDQHVAARLLQG